MPSRIDERLHVLEVDLLEEQDVRSHSDDGARAQLDALDPLTADVRAVAAPEVDDVEAAVRPSLDRGVPARELGVDEAHAALARAAADLDARGAAHA